MSRGMPKFRKTRRSHDVVPMPVPQGQVAESVVGGESAMETTLGLTLRVICGVPRSHKCIAEEGEGTHDCAAVAADHVQVPAALQALDFRQWAAIVQFFATGK